MLLPAAAHIPVQPRSGYEHTFPSYVLLPLLLWRRRRPKRKRRQIEWRKEENQNQKKKGRILGHDRLGNTVVASTQHVENKQMSSSIFVYLVQQKVWQQT